MDQETYEARLDRLEKTWQLLETLVTSQSEEDDTQQTDIHSQTTETTKLLPEQTIISILNNLEGITEVEAVTPNSEFGKLGIHYIIHRQEIPYQILVRIIELNTPRRWDPYVDPMKDQIPVIKITGKLTSDQFIHKLKTSLEKKIRGYRKNLERPAN